MHLFVYNCVGYTMAGKVAEHVSVICNHESCPVTLFSTFNEPFHCRCLSW